MDPDSNQQSNTSGVRRYTFPFSSKERSSIKCRCRSEIVRPVLFSKSSTLDRTMISPSSLLQIGIGVPQYLLRDTAQSLAFSSHLPKRPSLMCSGTQWICALAARILSLNFSTATNQELTAL